jgi:ABC-type transport system substrate-binding protein
MKSIGTGAYSIVNYNSTQEVTLIKNPNYNSSVYPSDGDRQSREAGLLKDAGAKLPFTDKIRLVVIKEAQTDWLNFLKQKVDLVNLTKDHYHVALTIDGQLNDEIKKQKIILQSSPTLIYWWIAFNLKDSIIGKNLFLRKAIAHGVNIDKYIKLFTWDSRL